MKTLNKVIIVLFLFSIFYCKVDARTDVRIQVINLPSEFKGEEIALAGTFNNWNNESSISVVVNDTLSYTFYDVDITPLDQGWLNKPEGANAAFSFFEPHTWNQRIVGNYGSNHNNFRVALNADTMNTVVIDAKYSLTSPPCLVIDVRKPSVLVNGKPQIPPQMITKLNISVINLPDEYEGRRIALIGSVVKEKGNLLEGTVSNHVLSFNVDSVDLSILGSDWTDSPLDANATFVFVDPQTMQPEIIGNYNSKDNYFRVRLAESMTNSVVIDANHGIGTSPLIIDKTRGIKVNGNLQLPNRSIDPTKYAWPEGKWKALIMSYDDGPATDTQLVGLFNKYGIVGTFNLASDFLDKPGFLSSSQIKDLFGGHEVANHTVHHPYLGQCDNTTIRNEIKICGDILKNLVGYDIKGLAYPFGGEGTGAYDYRVIDIAQNLGIRYARTTNDTRSLEIPSNLPDGLMKWNPTINDYDGITFAQKLVSWDKKRMALLYMWGHSHFLDEAGWTRMRTICQLLGNRDDIWYAKSIEVADYLRAIYNLVYTDSTVYNPSSDISIWIVTENGFKVIEPGETLDLTSVDNGNFNRSMRFELSQNYPNPFNQETVISYYLPVTSETTLSIYNLVGEKIKTLVDKEHQIAGAYCIKFDASGLASGIYIYTLKTEKFTISKKMVLLK